VKSALGFFVALGKQQNATVPSQWHLLKSHVLHPLGRIFAIIQKFSEGTVAFSFEIPMKHEI